MVRSMTGYGHAQATLHGRDISVEIRSVNHKYFDFSVRTPRGYSFVEDKIRNFVKENDGVVSFSYAPQRRHFT